MEKFKFKHFLLLGLFCLISFGASAEDIPNDEIWYTSKDGNAVTPFSSTVFGADIVSNTYTNGKGIIKFNGNVTSIGEMAFYWCSGLTTLTIPNSVTEIGRYVFFRCSGLTSIEIPNSVISIGDHAFDGCSNLTNVTIPNSVTSIGESAFYDCSAITSPVYNNTIFIRLPKSYTGSFSIPDGITTIVEYAFIDCSNLTSVTIPNSVIEIRSRAFENCSALTSVIIPSSVTKIGIRNPFENCSALTNIAVESGNKVYDSRDNCNAILKTETNALISGCKNTIIPDSVTKIGVAAFSSCIGLTSVTIPNSVTEIGESAFFDCSGLTGVYITDLDKWAEIKFGYLSANPLCYAHNLYLNGQLVTDAKLTTAKKIGSYAFYEYSSLSSITIPNSVTSIGKSAFLGCKGLTSVIIPNSVTSIGESVFQNCSGLTSVTIPNSVTSIGESVFQNCSGLTSVTIPNSVTSIGKSAFSNCSGLTSVIIPNSVTSIGKSAFSNCSGLTSVYVGWEDAHNIPSISYSDVFPYSTCDLYVPIGTKTIYQGKDYWKDFRNIYEYKPESVLLGDANDDGSVNVNDITTIATYILNGKATPWNEKNADANEDGSINVNDITATAAIILGGDFLEDNKPYLKCPDNHHPHVIDLGLPSGTKWCCCNVGATTSEGNGGYYAWGETSEKSVYNWETYAYYNSSTRYQDIGSEIAGTQYDVAHVTMGGSWHMPNVEQINELINNCTQTWTQQNGVNGILVTGKNGGQIFFPAAGYRFSDYFSNVSSIGYYWSSSLSSPSSGDYAYRLLFNSGSWNCLRGNDRVNGQSVRAVCP